MKNIVIGTVGHIDHGKTTLIHKLTGIDTDVLPEEKKRGITINIGFSHIQNDYGERIGIIDMPGHEKFIKNMVAGANGIHYILMVIACDDGIMPQTKEHFNICRLLGIEYGMIVLTKSDICTKERVNEVKDEISKYFKGTFLENSKIAITSLNDVESYINLKNIILEDIKKYKVEKKSENKFRLSVDRVFSSKGHGVVVTGTALDGEINIGENLVLYPKKIKVKVKKIENHGKNLEKLFSGNRCALNLGGVSLDEIKRGDIISKDENLTCTKRIDCHLSILNSYEKIKNNAQVKLNLGTKEIVAKIKIFGANELKGGEISFVQLEFLEPIIAIENDLGILRSLSPATTIGGVKILNVFAIETKRNNLKYIEELNIKFKGDLFSNIILFLKEKNGELVSENQMKKKFFNFNIKILKNKDEVREIIFENEKYFILEKIFKNFQNNLEIYFKKFYEKNNLKLFSSKAEIKNRYFSGLKNLDYNIYLEEFKKINIISYDGNQIGLKNYKIQLSKEQKKLKDSILMKYKEFDFFPLQKKVLEKEYLDRKKFEEMFSFLIEKELLIYLGDDLYILSGFYKESLKCLRNCFENNDKITLGKFKNKIKASRRVSLLLLEKFDELKITEKKEDYRVLKLKSE